MTQKLILRPSDESPHTLVNHAAELGLYLKVSRKLLMASKPTVTWFSSLHGTIFRLQQRVGRDGLL